MSTLLRWIKLRVAQYYPSNSAIYYRWATDSSSDDKFYRRLFLFFLSLCLFIATLITSQAKPSYSEAIAWQVLDQGGIAMITHPHAEQGIDDPYKFRMSDCNTQINLTDYGRYQARNIGKSFRDRGIDVGIVLHSRWCRTREAASLAFPGLTFAEAAFDSFSLRPENERFYTNEAKKIMARWKSSNALVLLTHPENIQALTGIKVSSGEALVFQAIDDDINVVGKITFQ